MEDDQIWDLCWKNGLAGGVWYCKISLAPTLGVPEPLDMAVTVVLLKYPALLRFRCQVIISPLNLSVFMAVVPRHLGLFPDMKPVVSLVLSKERVVRDLLIFSKTGRMDEMNGRNFLVDLEA